MRTDTFVLDGAVWVADAVASPVPDAGDPVLDAVAAAVLSWVTAPLSPGLATRIATFVLLGASWTAVAVELAVPVPAAEAVAVAAFVCVTGPASPPAPTRTSTFRFFGRV
jgi:hypothetical protein